MTVSYQSPYLEGGMSDPRWDRLTDIARRLLDQRDELLDAPGKLALTRRRRDDAMHVLAVRLQPCAADALAALRTDHGVIPAVHAGTATRFHRWRVARCSRHSSSARADSVWRVRPCTSSRCFHNLVNVKH